MLEIDLAYKGNKSVEISTNLVINIGYLSFSFSVV